MLDTSLLWRKQWLFVAWPNKFGIPMLHQDLQIPAAWKLNWPKQFFAMSFLCPREFGQRIFEELGWRRWRDLGILDQIGTHEMLTSQAGFCGRKVLF